MMGRRGKEKRRKNVNQGRWDVEEGAVCLQTIWEREALFHHVRRKGLGGRKKGAKKRKGPKGEFPECLVGGSIPKES